MRRSPAMLLAVALAAAPSAVARADDFPLRPSHILTHASAARPFPLDLGPGGLARHHADRIHGSARAIAWSSASAADARSGAVHEASTQTAAAARAGDGLAARPGAFEALRGQLASPAPQVAVIAPFGPRSRAGSPTVARHTGITFAPAPDQPALAVADGVCLYADRIDGLGMVVLLQHQDGYLSVYANLARTMVSAGQTVSTAQPVGETGAASSFGEDGLYFELREMGVPIDPAPWFAPRSMGSGPGTSR